MTQSEAYAKMLGSSIGTIEMIENAIKYCDNGSGLKHSQVEVISDWIKDWRAIAEEYESQID